MTRMKGYALMFLCYALWLGATAEQCGRQAGGALCPNGLCCSAFGWCGTTKPYCGKGCQSHCSGSMPPPPPPPTPAEGDITEVISKDLFNEMLKHRDDPECPSHGFYTYEAFINASQTFSGFGTTGDQDTRKREVAAFLAQSSHETSGGWRFAKNGPHAWGYCIVNEPNAHGSYCVPSRQYPCARGKKYYGRGPIQLSYNYNYGEAGEDLGLDLLTDPDLVSEDPITSFKTAIWYWMKPQKNIPSSHDVITGAWIPSRSDMMAGRVLGYGAITNIFNGVLECGHGFDFRANDRMKFYKRFCDVMGIDYGDGLDCGDQVPFTWAANSLYQIS